MKLITTQKWTAPPHLDLPLDVANPLQVIRLATGPGYEAITLSDGGIKNFQPGMFASVLAEMCAAIPFLEIETEHGREWLNPHFIAGIYDEAHGDDYALLASGVIVKFRGQALDVLKRAGDTLALIPFAHQGGSTWYLNPYFILSITSNVEGVSIYVRGWEVRVDGKLADIIAKLSAVKAAA
ncbi:MAG TPA: hypothetical protein VGF13_16195 [Verrucomicrobiae bacterium]|jgi:hypothetical protein